MFQRLFWKAILAENEEGYQYGALQCWPDALFYRNHEWSTKHSWRSSVDTHFFQFLIGAEWHARQMATSVVMIAMVCDTTSFSHILFWCLLAGLPARVPTCIFLSFFLSFIFLFSLSLTCHIRCQIFICIVNHKSECFNLGHFQATDFGWLDMFLLQRRADY